MQVFTWQKSYGNLVAPTCNTQTNTDQLPKLSSTPDQNWPTTKCLGERETFLCALEQPQTPSCHHPISCFHSNKSVCHKTQTSQKEFKHYMLVVPHLTHSVYIGADILVRLGAQLDTVNNVLCSQAVVDMIALLIFSAYAPV